MNTLREFDRVEAERLRRIKDCLDAGRPERSAVRQAMQRWNRAKSGFERRLPVRSAWLVAIVLLVSGGAMAASGVISLPSWASFKAYFSKTEPAPNTPIVKPAGYVIERRGGRQVYLQPTDITLLPGEQVGLIVDDAKTEFVGPGVAHIRATNNTGGWVTHFEPQGWAPELVARESLPTASNVVPANNPPEATSSDNFKSKRKLVEAPENVDAPLRSPKATASVADFATNPNQLNGAWARAAAAMRQGDDSAASAALTEISHSADPATRDAALLAQAQLDLAAGRRARAKPVLIELARSGSTGFVRQRSSEIIATGK